MSRYDYPDASSAVVTTLTEGELAAQLAAHGAKLHLVRGRYWRESRGWWEPIHRLARLTPDEIRRPLRCWGYRASLDERHADRANGTFPVHLMADVTAYGDASIPRDARRAVRRIARQGVRIVQLTDSQVLRDQGYELMLDWHRRVGPRAAPLSPEGFIEEEEEHLADAWLVLAALEDDRLLGYSTAWAVDDIAYLHEIKVATAEVRRGITAALDFEALQAFRRAGTVIRVTMGLHEPEKPRLTAYKVRNGFPVVHVPSRVWMLKPSELLMRARRPLTYYRLTGRESAHMIRSSDEEPAADQATPGDEETRVDSGKAAVLSGGTADQPDPIGSDPG